MENFKTSHNATHDLDTTNKVSAASTFYGGTSEIENKNNTCAHSFARANTMANTQNVSQNAS